MSDGAERSHHLAADTRRILIVLALSGFASTFAMRFFDPMVAVIARDLEADPRRIALLASAYALPYALVQPVLGPIGDALGKERIMTICLACLSVALLACAVAPNDTFLFVFRAISGAAAGGVIPLALATIGDRVEMAERQFAISRFLLFSISGQLLGGTMAGVSADALGWRGVVFVGAAIALAGFVGFWFGLRGRAAPTGRFTFVVAAERYRRILALGRARALFAFVFIEGLVIFGIQPYIAPLLEARGAGGAFESGLILACFALGGVIYTFIVRWLLRVFGSRRMLMLAGLMLGCACVVLASSPHWRIMALMFLGIGCGFYMLHNTYQTQVTELVSDARASAVSLHAFSFFCGQALGPVIIGATLPVAGIAGTFELCAIGALGLALASAFVLFPRQRAR